jgi:Flp pilus assembly protein TadB
VLAALNPATRARQSPDPAAGDSEAGWSARAGRRAVPLLTRLGLPTAKTRRDLAILGRTPEHLLASQAATGATGLLLTPMADLWFTGIGVPLPATVLVGAGLAASAVMFWMPVLILATAAEQARTECRAALTMFLDLASSALMAGGGVEQSLIDAGSIGDGPTFTRLRAALAKAHLARTSIPEVFGELAELLDSADLRETAASLALTGSEGARIKDALQAKAGVLRARALADVQAAAESATERAGLPIAVMFFGFLITIGFPALSKVLAGL